MKAHRSEGSQKTLAPTVSKGQTALDIAVEHEQESIMAMLEFCV